MELHRRALPPGGSLSLQSQGNYKSYPDMFVSKLGTARLPCWIPQPKKPPVSMSPTCWFPYPSKEPLTDPPVSTTIPRNDPQHQLGRPRDEQKKRPSCTVSVSADEGHEILRRCPRTPRPQVQRGPAHLRGGLPRRSVCCDGRGM